MHPPRGLRRKSGNWLVNCKATKKENCSQPEQVKIVIILRSGKVYYNKIEHLIPDDTSETAGNQAEREKIMGKSH